MTQFAFLSDNGFLKARAPEAATPFAVAGVAWDGATTNRPGARMGPRAIRQASHMLCDGTHPHFDVSPLAQMGDVGDLALPNTGLVAMRAALEPQALALIRRHHMAWLGGDHSITLSLLRAYHQHLGRPLAVIHFDAHCDTWSDHFGEPSGHGTWVSEAVQEGLVLPACFVQVGLRSAGQRGAREYIRDQGGLVHTARDLRGAEGSAALAPVLDGLRQRLAAHGSPPLYLSLDIDCLDPAFAPGTGTPVWGGLSSAQAARLLRGLAGINLVGGDVVEVSPPFDSAAITAVAGAHVAMELLCLWGWTRR
jgi:agmatinase